MGTDRRGFVAGIGAVLALGGCGAGVAGGAAVTRSVDPALVPRRTPGFDAWLAGFRGRAAGQGIGAATLDGAFRDAGYVPGVVERDRNQTEFTRTLEDYLSIAASETRVREGRAALARNRGRLDAIAARYGVPAEVVTAIWGMESNYGARRGDIPVVSSTATLAYDGRRGVFFERQLVAALGILERGDVTPARMVGSWAGAMGHTQFIPTSYRAFAVDFDGDGRRDIWSEDPTDALASAAAYLSRNGWRSGLRWGAEAGTPAAAGIAATGTIQPQPGGPRFAVTRNFRVIKSYNNSDSYAIGVGHLSDRIAGAGPLRGSFPPDRYGLSKAQRQALQRGLTRAGFDTGGDDGVLGPKSRAAIAAYQASRGLAATGEPSGALLASLG